MHRTISMKAKFQSPIVRIVAIAWVLFLISPTLTTNSFAADPPVLMLLEYRAANGERVQTEIVAKGGETASPLEQKTQFQWAIRSGDALKTARRPEDRLVDFYRGSGTPRILLCTIKLRYFRNREDGWSPRYLLDEQPLLKRVGGRWKPVLEVQGVPNLVVRTGGSLPNAEGFFPSLEFGLTSSRMTIDSWVVR